MRRSGLASVLVGVLLVTACGGTAAPSASPPATASAAAPAPAATAAPSASKALEKIEIGYAAVSSNQASAWVAKDKGIFAKYGLDATLENIGGGSSPTAALLADKITALQISVEAMSATLQGGDIVYVAAPISVPLFWLISGKGVKTAADLKGKKVAATGIGTATYYAAVLGLQKLGLTPTDVTFVHTNTVPAILAAVESGQVAAGAVSMPTYSKAKAAGLNTLVNVADVGFRYPSSWVAVRRKTIQERPDLVAAIVKAETEAISVEIKDPAATEAIIGRYTKITDQALLKETYDDLAPHLNKVPTPAVDEVKAALGLLAATEPKAKTADPQSFVDTSFVDALQKSGFIDSLYK